MSCNAHEKAQKVFDFFNSSPFTKWWGLSLEFIGVHKSVVSMKKAVKHCTPDMLLTGGVHNYMANAAAVSLAMMHSEHFTPLKRNEMVFYRPILLDLNDVFVEATLREISGKTIIIDVVIKDLGSDKLKAEGIFRYALLDAPYSPRH